MQKQARQSNVPPEKKTDNPKVQDIKDDSLEEGKEDKSKVSSRELAFMGQEGKAVEDQVTDWAMGINAHTENKESEFSKDLTALKMPFGAGPSGTTSRICDTSRLLGIEPDTNTRLACIGYLLPIHAHSMWEIVDGAATQGVEGIDWRNLGVNAYEEIKPFTKAEVRSLKEAYGIPAGADAEPEAPVGGAGAGAASDDDDGTG